MSGCAYNVLEGAAAQAVVLEVGIYRNASPPPSGSGIPNKRWGRGGGVKYAEKPVGNRGGGRATAKKTGLLVVAHALFLQIKTTLSILNSEVSQLATASLHGIVRGLL